MLLSLVSSFGIEVRKFTESIMAVLHGVIY